MALQVPYSKTELALALVNIGPKIEDYDELHGEGSFVKFLEDIVKRRCGDEKFTTEITDSSHGVLMQDYRIKTLNNIREDLKGLGLTTVETWALIMAEYL